MMRDLASIAAERDNSGAFVRQNSRFRDRIAADGSSALAPEPGRYHLYVSLACPWAHRAVIVRMLKGLEDAIPMTVLDPVRDERGWRFRPSEPDPLNGWDFLAEAYESSDPSFAGRVTVPVLWDRETESIVNNESADIIVDLNGQWNAFARNPDLDLYPAPLRPQIDELNAWIYSDVNDGVYRSGFATTQGAYEHAVTRLFEALDRLDALLGDRRYLAGSRQTLADWRLFTTLIRFDAVYHGHFKCNIRRLVDYPNLWPYVRDLHSTPGVAETVSFSDIKRHYYMTHGDLNPMRIVPLGPALDLLEPHGRQRLGA